MHIYRFLQQELSWTVNDEQIVYISGRWYVTASFVQIYLETLQDLLAPDVSPSPSESGGSANRPVAIDPLSLRIREDPVDGFFVEGVTKYTIGSFEEAVELVNHGLENRAMAPTLGGIKYFAQSNWANRDRQAFA